MFGSSVVNVGNNLIIVGSPFVDQGLMGQPTIPNAGAVYVFENSGGTWIQTIKIVASDRSVQSRFGHAIDIDDNNRTLVVGAPQNGNDGIDFLSGHGAVYVYNYSGGSWANEQKIIPNDIEEGDRFGSSVGIHSRTVILGSPYEDHGTNGINLSNSGSAYIYQVHPNNHFFIQKVSSSNREPGSYFGGSVDINSGASTTDTTSVTLVLAASDSVSAGNALQMAVSVNGGTTFGAYENFSTSKNVTLPTGNGMKTVMVRYRDEAGNVAEFSDTINLQVEEPPYTAKNFTALGDTHVVSDEAARRR